MQRDECADFAALSVFCGSSGDTEALQVLFRLSLRHRSFGVATPSDTSAVCGLDENACVMRRPQEPHCISLQYRLHTPRLTTYGLIM